MSSLKILIREYNSHDLDSVIDIFQRAVRETANKDYNAAQVQAWSTVDRERWEIRRSDRPTWIAFVDERPAGFTDLESDGHLDMLFVHPDFNGKGVASALLEVVEQAAFTQHLPKIYTESSLTAKPFFEKRGFTVITEQSVERRGQTLNNFQMEKLLVNS